MSFVKANVIYDCCESMIYDDQTYQKLNHNGKAGIGFQKPENSKPSWLKNKLDKDKAKSGRKSFVPNQPWRSSTKVKSGWKKVQPKRGLSGHSMKSKLNRSHSTYAHTLMDSYTGRTVKLTADCDDITADVIIADPSTDSAEVTAADPSCPASLVHHPSIHFDDHDTAATAFSLPAAATPDLTEALAQLRASIEQIRDRVGDAKLKYTLILHLHDIEQRFTACLDDQERVLRALRKDSHNQKQLLSLDIKSSQKQLSAQAAAAALDTVDVRRVVKELDAKVTYLDGQVAATRNDLLEFRATAHESLNHITDQLSELVNYINRGGNDKKGEDRSSRRPQPPPDNQGRGSGNNGGDNIRTTDIVDIFPSSMYR
ncbi:hypothetical protein F511_37165 [Dorcoceras hygrometricum]|uniref:Uncharacterized protein n=1 Tax=Dorcoceras hygrometricum TaxID=472368 RepID=A0A2Z7AAM1_9LAMI|nr:hypothetical protein F511_37165 [Dorcoceras hygrometricum]